MPLFAVLALFDLLVVRLFGFLRVVDLVDPVEVMLGDRLDVAVVAGGGDLLGEHEVGIVNGGKKAQRLGVLVRNGGEIHRVVADDAVRDAAPFSSETNTSTT